MHRNAVPAPPIIEIQHSHTSNFTKMLGGPQPPVMKLKANAHFRHL